jgi:hypothetical protein
LEGTEDLFKAEDIGLSTNDDISIAIFALEEGNGVLSCFSAKKGVIIWGFFRQLFSLKIARAPTYI